MISDKAHNTTWHSWVGVACLAFHNLQLLGSLYSLWPNKPRTAIPRYVVTLHKYGGRVLFLSSLVAMHLGFYKLRRSKLAQVVLFDAFLASVAVVCLTRWVYVKSLWSKMRI